MSEDTQKFTVMVNHESRHTVLRTTQVLRDGGREVSSADAEEARKNGQRVYTNPTTGALRVYRMDLQIPCSMILPLPPSGIADGLWIAMCEQTFHGTWQAQLRRQAVERAVADPQKAEDLFAVTFGSQHGITGAVRAARAARPKVEKMTTEQLLNQLTPAQLQSLAAAITASKAK